MSKTNVVIAANSFLLRCGLFHTIEQLPNMLVLKETENAFQTVRLLQKQKPDILLIDNFVIEEKEMTDFLKKNSGKLKTKIIAIFPNEYKNLEAAKFFNETIFLNDNKAFCIKKIQKVVNSLNKNKESVKETSELTEREKAVLRIIALGKTNKEVAEELFISLHTVVTHRKNITKKLGIKTVSGLTVFAIINKLIEINEL